MPHYGRIEPHMSASQDKKRRQAEREAGVSPKTLAERETAQKARKERRTWTIVGVIVALFVIVIILLNTNLFYTGTTAMTIGDYKFTNAEYQYYYNTAYNNFLYQYGTYASLMGLDTSSDLDEQPLNDTAISLLQSSMPSSLSDEDAEYTWHDYFHAVALDNMVKSTALWDAAVKAGYTLSDEDAEEIDAAIDNYATLAEQNNLRGADGYIAVVYGKGVDSALVRELLERAYIAQAYSEDVFYSFEYDRDEIDSYYDEHADAFDALSFEYYLLAAETEEVTETVTDEETGEETEETNDEVTDATMAEAKEQADAIAEAVKGGADFAETLADEIEDAELTEVLNRFGISVNSSFSDDMSTWLLDADRAEGDVTVIESPGIGYYIVRFSDRNDSSYYNGVSMRHILIQVTDSDEDGEISEEEKSAAEDELEEILDEWLADGGDEDSFAELANSKSDDGGSNSNGGLYEHIAVNQMVDPINDWLFEEGREPGDYEMIYVESTNYTGWHLVYFAGTDDISYHDCLAELGLLSTSYPDAPEGLRERDYNAWEDELESTFSVKINSFINWFAKV